MLLNQVINKLPNPVNDGVWLLKVEGTSYCPLYTNETFYDFHTVFGKMFSKMICWIITHYLEKMKMFGKLHLEEWGPSFRIGSLKEIGQTDQQF